LCLLLFRNTVPKYLPKKANILTGVMVNEFSSVLNERELHSFFEIESGEQATLPVDTENLSNK